MAVDYYGLATTVMKLLQSDGQHDLASRLEDVLQGGMGATEILMGLRHHIREILGENRAISENARAVMTDLIKQIDQALL
jgi:hypothetical protein